MSVDLEFKDLSSANDVSLDLEDEDLGNDENEGLLGAAKSSSESASVSTASMWTLDYYRTFFDVSTSLVLKRIGKSLVPGKTLYEEGEQADLYGPFWVATTLVVILAIMGNFASYLHWIPEKESDIWRSDFEKVTLAATTFYTAGVLLPLAMWGYLKRLGTNKVSLVRLASVYGYGNAIYVPAAIASVPRIEILRWVAVLVAFAISSQAFVLEVWRGTTELRETALNKPKVLICVWVALAAQFGIAMLIKIYFFQYSSAP